MAFSCASIWNKPCETVHCDLEACYSLHYHTSNKATTAMVVRSLVFSLFYSYPGFPRFKPPFLTRHLLYYSLKLHNRNRIENTECYYSVTSPPLRIQRPGTSVALRLGSVP